MVSKIDVSDLAKLGEASTSLQGAAIGHFLNEVQVAGDFQTAHAASLGVEGKIYGELVGDKTITSRTDISTKVADGYQTVIYKYNATNQYQMQQGIKQNGYETVNIGGILIKAPVSASTGELKSVKKTP